ncbi:hypothetical protein H0H87_009273 [Tephrocybe sp. NHM501043]|nr:hypothetical protein H0H87_009273 [Tephrocybe sp. NHM501043]
MHFFTAVFAALAIIPAVFAAPSRMLAVEKYDGETTGNYIVRLKDGVARSSFLDAANFTVTHQWDIINGFAGKLNDSEIDALRANSDVESIAEDGIMYPLAVTTQSVPSRITLSDLPISRHRTNAPWGLSRLSTYARLTNQNPESVSVLFVMGNTTDDALPTRQVPLTTATLTILVLA